jgi:hypothetical protein
MSSSNSALSQLTQHVIMPQGDDAPTRPVTVRATEVML